MAEGSSAPAGHTLTHLPALPSFADAPSLVQVVNELLKSKARAGKSDVYLKHLRARLKRFVQGMHNRAAYDVTTPDVESWLDRLDMAEKTRRHHLDAVRLLYNFAKRCGYVRENPAQCVELPDTSSRDAAVIHSPDQARTVLQTMQRADLPLCRWLAIRYFAGLRGSEVQRLTEANIMVERGFIEVPSSAAKTRRRRLVTIQPNLREWLALVGHSPVTDLNTRMSRVAKLTGVAWTPNVTRHSFCSYHLAQWQSAAKTALEAGHSEQMLFQHYREVVTPAQAAEFWAIRPA